MKRRVEDLVLLGAFEELEGQERAEFEALISEDPATRARFEQLSRMRTGLAMLKKQSAPLSSEEEALQDLRVRILDGELAARKSAARVGRFTWGLSLAGVACSAVFALSLALQWHSQANIQPQLVERAASPSSPVVQFGAPAAPVSPAGSSGSNTIVVESAPVVTTASESAPRVRTRERRAGLVARRDRTLTLASAETSNAEQFAELNALVIEAMVIDDSSAPASRAEGGSRVVVIGTAPDRATGVPKAAEVQIEGEFIIGN